MASPDADASGEILRFYQALVARPYEVWPTVYPGRRAVGYLCTYTPEEILHAAGLVPVRLLLRPGATTLADAHLPTFACALARSVLDQGLKGQLDFLEGIAFSHTCDTMQCLRDVWQIARPNVWISHLLTPARLDATGLSYFVSELRAWLGDIETHLGQSVTSEALRHSIAIYNEQRALLSRLDRARSAFPASDVYLLFTAAMLAPKEEFNAHLSALLSSSTPQEKRDTPQLLLSGATLDDLAIISLIEELGGRIAGDDLCTGSRYHDSMVDESSDPLTALAERYLARVACPAKHDHARGRVRCLLDLAADRAADGVVFLLPKFCDPHAFDYPTLANTLDAAGLPHLLLETGPTVSGGQMRTRIQAFLERCSS